MRKINKHQIQYITAKYVSYHFTYSKHNNLTIFVLILTGSNSTYQQFTTKKDLQDLTNSKPPDNFPSTGMPRSGALVKRRKAGFASCGSTVQQDHAHCATARKQNASERGNTIQTFQKQRSQEVYQKSKQETRKKADQKRKKKRKKERKKERKIIVIN